MSKQPPLVDNHKIVNCLETGDRIDLNMIVHTRARGCSIKFVFFCTRLLFGSYVKKAKKVRNRVNQLLVGGQREMFRTAQTNKEGTNRPITSDCSLRVQTVT